MILHRHPTIFFTPFVLAGVAIEGARLLTGGLDAYTPGWALPFTLTATCLLAVAVTAMLVVQACRLRFNVTPFLPALALAVASVLLLVVLSQPAVLRAEHWDTPVVLHIYKVLLLGALPVAAVSLALAVRGALAKLPLSLHAFGHGRLYRAEPGALAAAFGPQTGQARAQDKALAQPPAAAPAAQNSGRYRARPARYNFTKLLGNQELKDRLREAGEEWQAKGKNGVLLFGPPGTGKTSMGEALAGDLDVPFIYATFGDMASKWINETTERLVELFDAAEAQGPCVLFIDEIDAVLKDRTKMASGGTEEYQRIVATFLSRATALRHSKVLLVAATNFVSQLDEAAVREGRFDFKIEVPLPDGPARKQLIGSRLKANACTVDGATMERLVRRWAGFSIPRILQVSDTACELGRKAAGLALAPVEGEDTPAVALEYPHFYRALRKVQGRKGGAPEGAKALSELFLDAELTARLNEIAAQLVKVDDIERLGGSIPKGLLFMGPPGTGKTAVAKALARESGWSFIVRNGRELMRDGEIEKLRAEASDLRPAIVFLDEADDILADRAYSNVKSVTNELLTLMDGAGGTLQDVVWIAATNNAEAIDSAALRGGRFEQKIEFAAPGDNTLLRMVLAWAQAHAADVDAEPAMWAAKAAESVRGRTPGNIEAILRLANNLAVAKHVSTGEPRQVTQAHVAQAAAEIGE